MGAIHQKRVDRIPSPGLMCVSLWGGSLYAVGSVELRIAADVKAGPSLNASLHMKFGFGCEIAVGLPVLGSISLTFMVGVQIDLDTGEIAIAAFMLFKGRAEILGGIITVGISIEAKGILDRTGDETDLIAQVTLAIDISIFLIINISIHESWQERRQIA